MTNIELETFSALKSACREFISKEIDWEERRYEIAKAMMAVVKAETPDEMADKAIACADALIAKLK